MSKRHLGLIAVGLLFLLGSILVFVEGDVVIGAMSAAFGLMAIVVTAAELAPGGSGPQVEDGALVIRVSRVRQVLLVLGAVLFAAVGVLLAAAAHSTLTRLAGVLGAAVFGTFAAIGLWRLRGPWRLVMTPDALRWDHGAAGAPVGWDSIARAGTLMLMGNATMRIDVEPPRDGFLVRLNRRFGGGDVNVPLNQLSVDVELLLSLVTVCAREPEARSTLATEATARRLQA